MLISVEKTEIFESLSSPQFATLIKKGQQIILQPKSILFHQDDLAERCFMVNRGRLKLTMLSEQGKEVILRYLSSGELAAAIAVLRNQTYPVTAECVDETEVIGWDKPTIVALMHQYPAIAINLLGIVFDRIDDLQHRYLEMCSEHVNQRIARSLLRLMRRAGIKTPEGIHIDIPLSRQNIADYCGTTLSTVSRTLSIWEKKDWIKSGREKIIIKDPHALVLFAEGV
ncbi:MAG: Crp/Fnr family transcriptional regulator [Desulfobulbaceae bacterium]|nr:Crp/Fnr family transcriptional regulator [Desulfobulbaceae bacterium]